MKLSALEKQRAEKIGLTPEEIEAYETLDIELHTKVYNIFTKLRWSSC